MGAEADRNYHDEMGNRFNMRLERTRIQHTMGPVSIQLYDKFRLILGIETPWCISPSSNITAR